MHILLSSGLVTRFEVVASNNPSSSSSPPSQPQQQQPRGVKMRPNRVANKKKQKQQPSVMEIERAIGAGIFRERDVNSGGEGEKANLVDNILKNSVGKNEGSVEKRLRETGEWLLDQTETRTRSAGKQILMTIFVWIIPLWIAGFLVAAGIISLPFHTPFLDDLIS
ncbi:probable NAD(P)H dehydrogenase subunit CRR3, chloroplastic [Salvia splendens]|uniref:probable NAD(P)H dehydrogenase subunit CRR3, chloroplastic n=1 Tax=Salvia splendens TaxID=180675 RepID=UPI001C26C8D5|nr:probable NAD(P)H dehydrogenase subunit CRR3, chloroplastic [Salvia splendens]